MAFPVGKKTGLGFSLVLAHRGRAGGRGHDAGEGVEVSLGVTQVRYGAQITPRRNVAPSLQCVWSPGCDVGVGNALVLGLRVQVSF